VVKARIEVDHAGVEALLRSPEVKRDLERRAAAIAAAAGEGMASRTYQGRDRIRAVVWTQTNAARRAEAQNRALLRALDAGR
jgi:hypothetical protein